MGMPTKEASDIHNLDGYKKCYMCGKYYELGTEHPCFALHRDGGRRRQGFNEKHRIREKLSSLSSDK